MNKILPLQSPLKSLNTICKFGNSYSVHANYKYPIGIMIYKLFITGFIRNIWFSTFIRITIHQILWPHFGFLQPLPSHYNCSLFFTMIQISVLIIVNHDNFHVQPGIFRTTLVFRCKLKSDCLSDFLAVWLAGCLSVWLTDLLLTFWITFLAAL